MGDEIIQKEFSEQDFKHFQQKLKEETALLSHCFQENKFDDETYKIGMELETCLTDTHFIPAAQNDLLLSQLQHPLVVPELSQYNVEFNINPENWGAYCFRSLYKNLKNLWSLVQNKCDALQLKMLMIGCLPTLEDTMLNLSSLSHRERYRALNYQVLKLRRQKNAHIKIIGEETLEVYHPDVMLEAAATSMQIHLQVPYSKMNSYFNASLLSSAPLVALSANAPFLFGKKIWSETRIPVFEEAVHLPAFFDRSGYLVQRVGFGSDFVRENLLEFFLENLHSYPILLPIISEKSPEHFSHLRLHNGTIWRWNRPILGVEEGKLHLRIEQRVCSAGPTCVDMIANTAFFCGLAHSLACSLDLQNSSLPFEEARANFYQSAQYGLKAELRWLDGKKYLMQNLILEKLIPQAEEGLKEFKIDKAEIEYWLREILFERIKKGQNGSNWQSAFIHSKGKNFQALTEKYFEYQEQDLPVHLWEI